MLVSSSLVLVRSHPSRSLELGIGTDPAHAAMLYAGVLQHFIFKMSPCHDNQPAACVDTDGKPWPANISVWVVAGPYIVVGISEIFASITSLEYAFTKAPVRMKSVVMAFSQFQVALSSALNFALTGVNIEPNFAWLFGSFGVTAWVCRYYLLHCVRFLAV